jgi:rod shape determining protein RodA
MTLALIGAVLVWSATKSRLADEGGNPQGYLYRHLANIGIGIALAVIAARVDVRRLPLLGPLLYLGSLLGLLAVFAIGSTINGAHAWILLPGGMALQPSEFMKLGLIVGLAVTFTQLHPAQFGSARACQRAAGRTQIRAQAPFGRARAGLFAQALIARSDRAPTRSDILLAVGLISVPLVLIMLQPDLGSAMVLAATAFGLLIAADVPARWTLGLIAIGAVGVFLAIKSGVLADYQLARFRVFAHPSMDTRGAAYNVTQAHIAIANGGLFGRGLFQGPQTRGAFVPEQQTDFVYSVAGEEFGLVGAGLIILLFAVLCWRGLRIGARADRTGRLIAVGVVCWFAFQAFQNIGMNLGLTPVTGLPLPFVSYGGSSMFAQSLAVGLLIAVDRYSAAQRSVV